MGAIAIRILITLKSGPDFSYHLLDLDEIRHRRARLQ